jgi:diguanylate cyclase (GGDEF)-like protein
VKPFQAKPLFARIRAGLRVIKLQEEQSRDKERIDKVTAELAIANRRLEMDALTDVLTGLPNRRYLIERLSHDWAMARRSGQPLTCMVLDIDHFKRINDTYGHDVGDRVLERVAEVLRGCIRGTDVVCRYGGEEFVVVGADSDLDSSLRCAERLRHAVETEVAASFPKLERHVTVSIGVALRNETTRTPEMLLKAADEALYLAKQTGRNRVCSAATLTNDEAAMPARVAVPPSPARTSSAS